MNHRGRVPLRLGLVTAVTMAAFFLHGTGVCAGTEVGGPITSDTAWTALNSPYVVVASVEIQENATLTIDPGVTVRLDRGAGLQVDGQLIARGASGMPITFTSNQASPGPGDWGNIQFSSTAEATALDANGNYLGGSVLQYCIIEYGGDYTVIAGQSTVIADSLLIDHCTLRNNRSRSLDVTNSRVANNAILDNAATLDGPTYGGAGVLGYNSVISGNTVTGNSFRAGFGPVALVYGAGIYAAGNSTVTANIVTRNSLGGSSYSFGAGIFAANATVTGNTVSHNIADGLYGGLGGGIYAFSSTVSDNGIVSNGAIGSFPFGYPVEASGGGVYAISSTLSNNVISNNVVDSPSGYARGGGVYAAGGALVHNVIISNSGYAYYPQGSGVHLSGDVECQYNTIVGNDGSLAGLVIDEDPSHLVPSVDHNSLYANLPYDVSILSSHDISVINNYWGVTATLDIESQIYDGTDDADLGRAFHVPHLVERDPETAIVPPIDFSGVSHHESIDLSWTGFHSLGAGWGYRSTTTLIHPFLRSQAVA